MEKEEASALDSGPKLTEMEICLKREEIMENFRKLTYRICEIPCAFNLKESKIHYIGKDVDKQDPLEALRGDPVIKNVGTSKLKVKFHITSELYIGMINKEFVDSRRDFDKLTFECWHPLNRVTFNDKNMYKLGSKSFQDAMKIFDCTMSCNMEYYLTNKDEIGKDLNRRLKTRQLKNENYIKELENELFFKLLLDVFGDIQDKEEKEKMTVIFRKFHLLKNGSEFKIATAERKDHFINFYWCFDD